MALVKSDIPVLVRMETIRRATIYAIWPEDHKIGGSARNERIAAELLARFKTRVTEASNKSDKTAAAECL